MKGERVAQLELLLRSHPEGLRRAEIARRLGVHRSTISRYVDDLKDRVDIYEDNNLIKIKAKEDDDSGLALSVYESLAFGMSAEVLAANAQAPNPHLASGLRKLAMGMRSYAPKISDEMLQVAEKIDKASSRTRADAGRSEVLESLIDAWVTGRIIRLTTTEPGREEIELAPYFIGFREDENRDRKPITVTGRLRHTKDIITLDIASITGATLLDETYTIPDNLKPFRMARDEEDYDAIDMVPLVLRLEEKSALNAFHGLVRTPEVFGRDESGALTASFSAENSIELMMRLFQCGSSVEVVEPKSFRGRYVAYLREILGKYE